MLNLIAKGYVGFGPDGAVEFILIILFLLFLLGLLTLILLSCFIHIFVLFCHIKNKKLKIIVYMSTMYNFICGGLVLLFCYGTYTQNDTVEPFYPIVAGFFATMGLFAFLKMQIFNGKQLEANQVAE